MDDSNSNWIERYRPKKQSSAICNKKEIIKLSEWISHFNDVKKVIGKAKKNTNSLEKSCVLVTGNHGVGKTTIVDIVLDKYDYEKKNINFNKIKNSKNIDNMMNKLLNSDDIMNIISNNGKRVKGPKKKIAIVIDEIESITSTNEKGCIIDLLKLNEINRYCPIITISNNHHNKLLSDIKKKSLQIILSQPKAHELRKILFVICKKEGIRVADDDVVNEIISHVQGDIRRLIYTLQDIKYAYGNKKIGLDEIYEYCIISKRKDTDINLYKATDELLYNYKSIDDCLRSYETEKVLLPLMVHYNYPKHVIRNHNKSKRYKTVKSVIESLSEGDVIDNYIYGDQNWDMQEIHGFYTCVVPSYLLSNTNVNTRYESPVFTTDLNKTSIKKINKKNINNTNRCFKDMNIFDYIYINKIVSKLILNNEIERCVKLLKDYDIELEHIESLLKIDKINNTRPAKSMLTSKQKKEFTKFFKSYKK